MTAAHRPLPRSCRTQTGTRGALLALVTVLCSGCATMLGFSGAGIDTPATAGSAEASCNEENANVPVRWGEISGSLMVRATRSPGNFESGVTQLGSPVDVAVRSNRVHILDAINGQVLVFDRNTQAVRQRIPIPGLDPRARIHVDRALSLYVSNPATAEVLQFDLDGRVQQTFSSEGLLADPVGVAVSDIDGSVYVADGLSAQVVVFNPAGAVIDVIGPDLTTSNRFLSIRSIAVAPDQLYVVDVVGRKVHFLSGGGSYRYAFGTEALSIPGAITVDADNRVFVADVGDSSVKTFRGGELLSAIGGRNGAGRIHFEQIAGLWHSEGLLYVADQGTVSIKIFVTTVPCP